MDQIIKLTARYVDKPWGRTDLFRGFSAPGGRRIGEIWFETPTSSQLPLLAKFLFTGECLSVQVHPDDAQARIIGAASGKAECWYVLAAQPGAQVGVGLRSTLGLDDARRAALDGSIEQMLEWRAVTAGDFIFVPAGTVHAIGAGLTIIELQQNVDVTYRLFDYGRGRDLHLEQGLRAAKLGPANGDDFSHIGSPEDRILVSVPQFTVTQISSEAGAGWMRDRQRWVLPITGSLEVQDTRASVGECLLLPAGVEFNLERGSRTLVAAVGTFTQSPQRPFTQR